MKLTESQRRHLRGLGHTLKPIILIGQAGLTDSVVAETQRALSDHELIKVRIFGMQREARDAALTSLALRTQCELVARIGHVALFYRPNPERRRINLPA